MATTSKQDRDFIDKVISTTLLEESISYIKDNFAPEEVYSRKKLEEWATENGYSKDEE